eukprot:TRINITY_DN3108_c0_g1_i6.p1 TRINITY_DN3108_c0_g1~~TRINITY_DN3108_c0_g1_i6.p1  ORF type:complete len:201 (-),score=17.15 TRINITY_DN3108_c0_g1_i6:266-868(-)
MATAAHPSQSSAQVLAGIRVSAASPRRVPSEPMPSPRIQAYLRDSCSPYQAKDDCTWCESSDQSKRARVDQLLQHSAELASGRRSRAPRPSTQQHARARGSPVAQVGPWIRSGVLKSPRCRAAGRMAPVSCSLRYPVQSKSPGRGQQRQPTPREEVMDRTDMAPDDVSQLELDFQVKFEASQLNGCDGIGRPAWSQRRSI